MRLTEIERTTVKDIVRELDAQAAVYLFGSRTDDNKRGGDIDILILSEKLTAADRDAIRLKLYDTLGEQKIDIIIAKDTSDPFVRIAFGSGVAL